ncbi:MAG: carbamoyl phosphate synthase small subunit, partial [Eubacterium sp.]|nr:carbamoyl phosphate synthase small subunit [Eubacterium sp.]
MKAYLILEDGTTFTGRSIGSTKEVISEIVFNTSMTGYLEVLTDPSYAGQAVVMTYPLIGNYGICRQDMEAKGSSTDGFIVRELARLGSNFRNEQSIQDFLVEQDIPGIEGIDTRALTKILREKGTMNGMITTQEPVDMDTILSKIKEYSVRGVVNRVTTKEIVYYKPGDLNTDSNIPVTKKVAILDVGTKFNIARC